MKRARTITGFVIIKYVVLTEFILWILLPVSTEVLGYVYMYVLGVPHLQRIIVLTL